MGRAADFDLARALGEKHFTPAQRDAGELAQLIARGDEPAATRALPALASLGAAGRGALVMALDDPRISDDGARARLCQALGLHARTGDADALAVLLALLSDGASRVRRAVVVALGKLDGDPPRAALIARWDATDVTPDERRALAEALGKVGGEAALARLRALEPAEDAELARRRDRALLMADRTARRDAPSTVATDVPPPAGARLEVRLHCRGGLASLLAQELMARGFAPSIPAVHAAYTGPSRAGAPAGRKETAGGPSADRTRVSDSAVDVILDQPWTTLFASRLWATAGIRVPLAGTSAPAITAALTAPNVRALLAAWTRGPIRWRLQLAHGHQRAVVWRVARDVTAQAPELLNDPTATTWDVVVDEDGSALELVPRRAIDPRFAWRVADVAASSHPTVAAALAAVAGARADDRVWDPFCGSGAELVERARMIGAPPAALIGTDIDDGALTAARANVTGAGLTAHLTRGDAREHDPGEVDLVITNPPLGSRVRVDAAGLLVAALPNLARRLAPGGRLVWITPAPRQTGPAAERVGLVRTFSTSVDLGGVRGVLERWELGGSPRGTSAPRAR